MQSILRSSITNNLLFKNNNNTTKSTFLISRSFCNNNNHNHNENSTSASFEKFKENRNLIKKKSELIKELTQSKLLGNIEKVFSLQQQISSIEKLLDPSIESFSIQSKQQKEKELELWKLFIEKKGIKSKSELNQLNKFEFERFKNTGLLDIEFAKQQKEKDELLKKKKKVVFTEEEKLEVDDILHDPFEPTFVKSNKSSLKNKESLEEMQQFLDEIKQEAKNDPNFRLLVDNFLDDSIPLKDKLIFKQSSSATGKEKESQEGDEGEDEEEALASVQDLKNAFKKYRSKSNKEQKILKTNIRNERILKKNIVEADAITAEGTIDVKKFKAFGEFSAEDKTLYALHPDAANFGGAYLVQEGTKSVFPLTTAPYEVVFPGDVSDEKLKKLAKKYKPDTVITEVFDGESATTTTKSSKKSKASNTLSSIDNEDHDGESTLVTIDENSESLGIADEDLSLIDEDLSEDNTNNMLELEESKEGEFENDVIMAPDEDPDFFELDEGLQMMKLDGRRVTEFKEEDPVVKVFKDNLVAEGSIRDMETRIKHATDIPEFESPLLMKDLKMQLDKEQDQKDKQFLESNDPMMIRNFMKYKVDQEQEALRKQKEQNYREYSSALENVQQHLTEKSMQEMQEKKPIYNPVTGKIFTPKKKNPKCLLCQDPNWQVDPVNVPFLTLYLNEEGDILPRHYSGNCLKHQKKIAKTIKHAKSLGLFSYKDGTFTVEDPNVYGFNKAELEEYNKWYNASYSDEEWEQVVDELGELESDEGVLEADEKQDQQEQVMLEFGIEVNDVGKMYGKDSKQ